MDNKGGGTVVVRCNACNYTFSTHAKDRILCRRCRSGDTAPWRPARGR